MNMHLPAAAATGAARARARCQDDLCAHQAGSLEVRLAISEAELRAAQALRHRVFFEEPRASGGSSDGLDRDPYDTVCDHLLVFDRDGGRVVGTYRLLRQVIAEQHRGFYSSEEFDLTPLAARAREMGQGQLLELGRSCVDPAYRTNATIGLLWRGIASYLGLHRVTHMFGCASFPGTDPERHALGLAYLHYFHLAPSALRVRALPEHYVAMDRMRAADVDSRAALRALPPLIRGYLRVGAMVGDGAFLDRSFDTVDVFILMPVDQITRRYSAHFLADARGLDQ